MITEGIIIALITGSITLIGVLASNSKRQAVVDEKLAETDKKLTDLTAEVRRHNNFNARICVAENDIETLYRKVDELKEHK